MSKPLVSIIVPVYNCKPFLRKCVESLQSQTLESIEIILVDDGATDGSGLLCDELCAEFENISICHQSNKGQAAARNQGVILAQGLYVGFVDGDDWVEKSMYQTLYENAIKENAEISCCGICRVFDNSKKIYFNENKDEYAVYNSHDAIKELLYNKRITSSPCDKLFLLDIVKTALMREGMIFEDFEVMPRWLDRAHKIVYTGQPLYNYRQSTLGTMSNVTKKRLDEAYASEMRVDFIRNRYPDMLELFIIKDIETRLNVLSCTSSAPNSAQERKAISESIMRSVSISLIRKLNRVSKLKIVLLFLGLPFFDLIARNKK